MMPNKNETTIASKRPVLFISRIGGQKIRFSAHQQKRSPVPHCRHRLALPTSMACSLLRSQQLRHEKIAVALFRK